MQGEPLSRHISRTFDAPAGDFPSISHEAGSSSSKQKENHPMERRVAILACAILVLFGHDRRRHSSGHSYMR